MLSLVLSHTLPDSVFMAAGRQGAQFERLQAGPPAEARHHWVKGDQGALAGPYGVVLVCGIVALTHAR